MPSEQPASIGHDDTWMSLAGRHEAEIERLQVALCLALRVLNAYAGEDISITNENGPDYSAMDCMYAMAEVLGVPEGDIEVLMEIYGSAK